MLNSKLFSVIRKRFLTVSTKRFGMDFFKNYSLSQNSNQQKLIDISGTKAVITGGTGSVGTATAEQLIKKGTKHVILTGTEDIEGEEAVKILNAIYGENCCSYSHLDVTSATDFTDFFKMVESKGEVDILINNAGILWNKSWREEIDVNFTGMARGCLTAMHNMSCPKTRDKVVVNVLATAAIEPFPYAPVFTATKFATLALHQSLSDKYHFGECGIRFVAVCCGRVQSEKPLKFVEHPYSEEWTSDKIDDLFFTKWPPQEPETVAKGIIYGIEYGKVGSIYLVEDKKLKQVKLPKRDTFCRHVASCVPNYLRPSVF